MLSSPPMAYITHIHVENCRNVRELDIDLAMSRDAGEPAFRHLILTGPNGSGKSGVLEAIAGRVTHNLTVAGALHPALPRNLPAAAATTRLKLDVPPKGDNDDRFAFQKPFSQGALIVAYIPAGRLLGQQRVSGPLKLEVEIPSLTPAKALSESFLQFLVNKRTEMAYATADGDQAAAARLGAWFADFERHLQRIMEDEKLKLQFDRANYNFEFQRGDGYTFDIQTLADGHAAILALLAELLIRVDAAQRIRNDHTFEPAGIVIVDEIETHLHLKLQEDILPLLTELFPKFQFLVATHSPAVIASVPNAVVYDFAKKTATLSDELRGVRYGTLMTEHFGISSEIDLDSTEKLQELRKLADLRSRTAEQESTFDALAAELSGRSRTLAVEVWMIKEGLGGTSASPALDGGDRAGR